MKAIKKVIIIIGFVALILLSGCNGRDTFESECYGNCLDAYNCYFSYNSSQKEEKKQCEINCFNMCYKDLSNTSK